MSYLDDLSYRTLKDGYGYSYPVRRSVKYENCVLRDDPKNDQTIVTAQGSGEDVFPDHYLGDFVISHEGSTWAKEGVANIVNKQVISASIDHYSPGGGFILHSGILTLLGTGSVAGQHVYLYVTYTKGDRLQVFSLTTSSTALIDYTAVSAEVKKYTFIFNGTNWEVWNDSTNASEVVKFHTGGRIIPSYVESGTALESTTWDISGKSSANISGFSNLKLSLTDSHSILDLRPSETGGISPGDIGILSISNHTENDSVDIITKNDYTTNITLQQKSQTKNLILMRDSEKLKLWYPSTDPEEIVKFKNSGRVIPSIASPQLSSSETVVELLDPYSSENQVQVVHANCINAMVPTGTTGIIRLDHGIDGDTVHMSVSMDESSTLLVMHGPGLLYKYIAAYTACQIDLDFDLVSSSTSTWRLRNIPFALQDFCYGTNNTDLAVTTNNPTTYITNIAPIAPTGLAASSTYSFVIGARVSIFLTGTVTTNGFIDVVASGYFVTDGTGTITNMVINSSLPDQSKLPALISLSTAQFVVTNSSYLSLTVTRPSGVGITVANAEYKMPTMVKIA